MSSYGELVLILGDGFIPHRQPDIPEIFKYMLIPGKFDHIILTGNMGSKQNIEFFQSICDNVTIVRGMAENEMCYPEYCDVSINDYLIGVISGSSVLANATDGVLSRIAHQNSYDILVYGQTHEVSVSKKDGTLFLNPGSVTGAFHPSHPFANPSFLVLSLQQNEITVFIYQIINNQLEVSKSVFSH